MNRKLLVSLCALALVASLATPFTQRSVSADRSVDPATLNPPPPPQFNPVCEKVGWKFCLESASVTLQQILFYRELGFELKEIKRILDRPDFQNVAA